MKPNKNILFSAIVLFMMVALIVVLCINLVPLMQQVLANAGHEADMISYIDAYGWRGIPVLAGLQALQVVATFIPAAAVQILSGLCYGAWFGGLICIIGTLIGNAIVFTASRQFKNTFSPLFARKKPPKEKKKNFLDIDKLRHMRHPEYIVLILYLMPGIPNGILPYLFAQTKITFPRFMLSITISSIPSVLICTFLGDRIAKGDYLTAIIVGAALISSVVLLLVFKDKILNRVESKDQNNRPLVEEPES